MDLDAAERALDGVKVRLFTQAVCDPWPPGVVGELIAFQNTIHARVDGGKITAVHVDD